MGHLLLYSRRNRMAACKTGDFGSNYIERCGQNWGQNVLNGLLIERFPYLIVQVN